MAFDVVKKNVWKNIQGIILPLGLVAIWLIAFHLKFVSSQSIFFPSPEKVVHTFISMLKEGVLLFNIKVSFFRVAKGFWVGSSAGLAVGILMGLSKTVEKIIAPSFHAVRNVPLIGWIPLILIWFGIGEMSQVVFISIGAFYPVVLNTFQGVRGVSGEYIEVGRIFEYGKFKLLRRVIIPAALPSILTGLRLSLSTSWILVVAAEMFSVSRGGIGSMMMEGREQFKMDVVVVGIIVIGLIGFAMNSALELIESRFLRWKRSFR